jgi:hypothetical protein
MDVISDALVVILLPASYFLFLAILIYKNSSLTDISAIFRSQKKAVDNNE